MSTKSRILVLISAVMLLGVFFFPIWKIDLEAPQYPEGIGLRIWVNQITGYKEFDLRNINGLNHYIGMKKIEPESIPELKIMPYIIAGFILLGLIAAALKNRKIVSAWILLFLITLGIGFYDYYMWGYDYGHNLDPKAAIRVPGLTYQPPLFGTKQLLNMNAQSFPDIGTYIIVLSITCAMIALYLDKKSSRAKT
jgi:copper chaperone NosL